MELEFVDPPPRIGASAHPWGDIAEALRDRPGEWARALTNVHVQATQINSGKLNAFKPVGAFEARFVKTREKNEKGQELGDLYVRFLGDSPEERKKIAARLKAKQDPPQES